MTARERGADQIVVMHVTTWLPSNPDDSYGTFVLEHVNAAASRTCSCLLDVRIGARTTRAGGGGSTGLAVPTATVDRSPGAAGTWSTLVELVRAIRRLGRTCGRPDVLHFHTLRIAGPGAVVARLLRRKVVVTEHWTAVVDPANQMSRFDRACALVAYRLAHQVLPVGPDLERAVHRLSRSAKTTVVANAVDVECFRPRPDAEPARPSVLIVGALIPRKRIDLAVRAFADVGAAHVGLQIVGEGPERAHLKALVRELGLAGRVTFTGPLPKERLAVLMAQAAGLLQTSARETFSVVVAESLCCGTPVITTRSGGPEHLVDAASGYVVDDSEHAIAVAMERLLVGPWDRRAISDRAAARFGTAAVSDQLLGVYRAVLGGEAIGAP